MMTLDIDASCRVYRHAYRLATSGARPSDELRAMNVNIPLLLRVQNLETTNLRPLMSRHVNQSRVPHLSTHLGVERRFVEDDIECLFRAR